MNNEKGKTRFGFADAVIILLIIAVAAAITYLVMLQNGKVNEADYKTVEYSVKITSVEEEHLSALVLGAEVFDSATGNPIGYITNIRSEKTKYASSEEDERGNVPVMVYDDIYDVFVTVVCTSATVNETGFCNIGNLRILVGSQIYFSSGYLNRTGYCTRFEIRDAQ